MPIQAPKGGIVSPVNGRHYDGGEFLPDHGHYCGRGRHRVTTATFRDAATLAEAKGYDLRYSDQYERFELWRDVRLSDGGTYPQLMLTAASLATFARILRK